MPKYSNLKWSHGASVEQHPANSGGDCLVWFAFDGDPPKSVADTYDGGEWDERQPSHLVGWAAIDHAGRCSACFEGAVIALEPLALSSCFEWVREQNGEVE